MQFSFTVINGNYFRDFVNNRLMGVRLIPGFSCTVNDNNFNGSQRSLRTSTVERANHNHVMSVLLFFITQQEIQAKHSHKQFLQPLPAAQTPYEN